MYYYITLGTAFQCGLHILIMTDIFCFLLSNGMEPNFILIPNLRIRKAKKQHQNQNN